MSKWYSNVSVIVLNSILLTTIVLIILWGVLEGRHFLSGKGSVVISDAIKFDSFKLTRLERAKATAKEFDVNESRHPFVFNPWTTFMAAPVEGDNLNVVADPILNHRFVPHTKESSTDKNKKSLVIWAFGGSTLYGFGVPDDQTIPNHLSKTLATLRPDRDFKVVNFGQPHWFSSVEVAGYSALLRSGRKPDIVLFLDGLNDMVNLIAGRTHPFFADQAFTAWERSRSDARRKLPWMTINESFPITRILRFFESKFGEPTKANTAFREIKPKKSDEVVRLYKNNIKVATSLSDTFGVRPYFFIQPVSWYGTYAASNANGEFPFGNLREAKAAYEKMIAFADENNQLHSLHATLFSQNAPFVDNYHYSDVSNRLLAQKIAEVILGSIK